MLEQVLKQCFAKQHLAESKSGRVMPRHGSGHDKQDKVRPRKTTRPFVPYRRRFAKRAFAVDEGSEQDEEPEEAASSEHSSGEEGPDPAQVHAADDGPSQGSEQDSEEDDALSEDSAVADVFMAGSKAGWKAKRCTADRRQQRGFRTHSKPESGKPAGKAPPKVASHQRSKTGSRAPDKTLALIHL